MAEKYVNSVKKALDVLDVLAFEDPHRDGISLTELSKRTGIRPNTLHAILKTMAACGYVRQNSKLRYLAGKRCRQIGLISRVSTPSDTAKVLDIELNRLCEATGESVSLYMLDHGERINYTNINNDEVKVDYSMLEENSIYWYPSGKILVAFCSERELGGIIRKNGYPGEIWDNADTREKLEAAAKKVRDEGWSTLDSPINSVSSFSLPVFTSDGSLLGALGVYMPCERKTDRKVAEIRNAMEICAKNIKNRL